ncbi:heavy metal sensor histidine kinase [Lacisediminimonas sp.]|uniref:heavy metal sensor histidine kinase n=1 Tax=Lacisediminimonas sp. TaxID=3060582 RepID=UPI0027190A0E|nr:heavy metal sensor histidine kinase [Lacisediminimonas sp.]MDO8299316.1 heavy metal sensor histidine kinase [Lacisediminimonas sp.]
MYWKTAAGKPAVLSLTLRLAGLFAAVAAATFSLVGAYLYQALDTELRRRDAHEIAGKVELVRHLLSEYSSLASLEKSPRDLQDALIGHRSLVLQLETMEGRPFFTFGRPSRPLPPVPLVESGREVADQDIREWTPEKGKGLIVGAIGKIAAPAETNVRILVAVEDSDRSALLDRYGLTILLGMLLGSALAAALGYGVVRYGLRPLDLVIEKTNSITTRQLYARLNTEGAPLELHAVIAAFNAMLDRLQEGVDRLSRFSADLAHDLRTPLNTLMMQTQVALSRIRDAEEYERLLASNLEEYEQLSKLIENTLFLARAENAQLAIRRENLVLRDELARVHDYFSILAEEGNVRLIVGASSGEVFADPMLFQRALNNLVSNAVAHTPAGGEVEISAHQRAEGCEIEVRNTGARISADHLERIFDRFYRADPSRSSTTASTGLGLSIVRAIMAVHSGTACAQSEGGEGARFRLFFPKSIEGVGRIRALAL